MSQRRQAGVVCPMAFVISTCSAACACSDADEGLGISSATEEVLKIAGLMAQMASPRTTCFCARIPMAFHRTEGESIAQRNAIEAEALMDGSTARTVRAFSLVHELTIFVVFAGRNRVYDLYGHRWRAKLISLRPVGAIRNTPPSLSSGRKMSFWHPVGGL